MMSTIAGLMPAANSPAMTTTYSRPTRNITKSMRAASPGSRGYPRPVLIAGPSSGDEALVGEQVPYLVEGRVGGGQDQLRGADVVVGQRFADLADLVDEVGERGV